MSETLALKWADAHFDYVQTIERLAKRRLTIHEVLCLRDVAWLTGASAPRLSDCACGKALMSIDNSDEPDYDYATGRYVHVEGCGCAAREWE